MKNKIVKRDLNPKTMVDPAKSRVRHNINKPLATVADNEAVRQSQEYFHDLLEVIGELIFLCTYRLLMASVRGIYAGISTFFKEIGK